MDIRRAKPPLGTMPPRSVASEGKAPQGVNIDDKGEVVTEEIDFYGGDMVVKGYMEYLEKNNIHEDDISEVMEVLFTTGSVSWSFELFDRIPVTFVSRSAWVDNYISEILDKIASQSSIVSNVRFNNIVAECNLAASMSKYGDNSFSIAVETDMEAAREFVRQLPYVIHNALVRKLAVFDRLLAVATSDWAIKNFMKPRQEKSERS